MQANAELCILVDSIYQPIAFASRSINKFKLCRSVIQIEAYSIFHSCTYLRLLQRDSLFKK